jgi:hypothetical protein
MLKLINIIKKDYVCERETIQSIRVEKTSVTLMDDLVFIISCRANNSLDFSIIGDLCFVSL